MSDEMITSVLVISTTAMRRHEEKPVPPVLTVDASVSVAMPEPQMFVNVLVSDCFGSEIPLSSEPGETRVFQIEATGRFKASQIAPSSIIIQTEPPHGVSAWLPASFYLLGKGASGEWSVICAVPSWPSDLWIGDAGLPSEFSVVTLDRVLG